MIYAIPWWAVTAFLRPIVIIALATIFYGLLLRRLATVVEPYRMELAERGEKYLILCDDPKEKQQIRYYLDNAFNPWFAITVSIMVWALVGALFFTNFENSFNKKIEDEHEKIANLFTLSVFAANPLFGTIVTIEICIAAIVIVLVKGNFVCRIE